MEGTMHPRRFFVSITLTAALLAGAGAHAQDAQRYRLEKSNDGFVRMDTQTGAMSICEEKGAQLVCRAAADERTAFQEEIERLQDQVKALDERVSKLENSLAAKLESSLPSEEEFNRTIGYMERFLRSFMDIVRDMSKEDPAPQKT
jgi:flagellar motility protein MotE (MotC chaperone)